MGEVVNVRLNFVEKKVIFSKGMLSFEQPVNMELGTFHAFAGPTNNGDMWKVIN